MTTNTQFSIAVLPGDGIGPDVIAEGIKVLRAVERSLGGVHFELREYAVGANEYLRNGDPLPPATVERCRQCDAILLGAMGLPEVRWPSGVEMTPQIDLREQLDLYCGLRPIRLYHAQDTPLKSVGPSGIDFVIIRESTEGLFSARHGSAVPSDAPRATDTLCISRAGAERICRSAFDWAVRRRGLCTLVDKANVLPSMAYLRRCTCCVGRTPLT
jgi:3-isopropylmalate dehydrogenase